MPPCFGVNAFHTILHCPCFILHMVSSFPSFVLFPLVFVSLYVSWHFLWDTLPLFCSLYGATFKLFHRTWIPFPCFIMLHARPPRSCVIIFHAVTVSLFPCTSYGSALPCFIVIHTVLARPCGIACHAVTHHPCFIVLYTVTQLYLHVSVMFLFSFWPCPQFLQQKELNNLVTGHLKKWTIQTIVMLLYNLMMMDWTKTLQTRMKSKLMKIHIIVVMKQWVRFWCQWRHWQWSWWGVWWYWAKCMLWFRMDYLLWQSRNSNCFLGYEPGQFSNNFFFPLHFKS